MIALATLAEIGNHVLIASAAIAGALVLVGPLVGYELSQGRARTPSPITVVPTLGYDGRSGTIGAAGTF